MRPMPGSGRGARTGEGEDRGGARTGEVREPLRGRTGWVSVDTMGLGVENPSMEV